MPDLRQIHHDILAVGRVDTPMLELLRRSLYNRGGGGKIDRPEADVLVDLHKRVERTNPAFEAFYYRAVKDHVLADGAIKPDETLWLRQTLFRQTLFAEFEKTIHERAERGETLTGDNMSDLYLQLARTYYGDAQGTCKVDSLYKIEWAYIPHFYYNFYVYQYATSLVASTSIANAIRDEAAAAKPGTKARDAYIQMLSSGSSKFPIDLLKGAGVDMTTSAPFNAAMREMNKVMDQMEAILDKRAKTSKG